MTNIHWLIPYDNPLPNFICESIHASIRLRLGALIKFESKKINLTAGTIVHSNANIIIIGKTFNKPGKNEEWIDQILKFKKKGAKIILDYTDNHLSFESPARLFYHTCINYVDHACVSSSYLRDELSKKFYGAIKIIEDANEIYPPIKPFRKNDEELNVMWFGHFSNLIYLINLICNWPIKNKKTTFCVLTDSRSIEKIHTSSIDLPGNISIMTCPWSPQAMRHYSNNCNICVIPSDPKDPKKAGVSSNRLISAFSLGLPTAASNVESYLRFSEYFTNIDSVNFIDLLDNPNLANLKILDAQEKIVPKFSFIEIGNQWSEFLSNI